MNTTTLNASAVFVGQAILDQIARVNEMPGCDNRERARPGEIGFQAGGNATVAGLTCSALGWQSAIVSGVADDDAGRLLEPKMRAHGVHWLPRAMERTPIAMVIVNPHGRAIVTSSDKEAESYSQDFPRLDLEDCRLVHVDGRQRDAAEYYVDEAVRLGIPVSIDVGRQRPGIEKLLAKARFASVSSKYCHDTGRTPEKTLADLRRHAEVGIVTLGEKGLKYFVKDGPIETLEAFPVPHTAIVDESGSGDLHNGARCFSHLYWPDRGWEWHLRFANAVVAWKLTHFGNASPTLGQAMLTLRHYGIREVAA
ncbi:MAG: hypothetical protein HYS26_03385 [Candidatus Kaiserbacteria bacterium]|nr:MAG: hypothetical protein HYS26_03385 [Candidatus Kaiserbacteria bacterium]